MLLNRSFSRRIGKSLSKSQRHLIDSNLPSYLLHNDSIKDSYLYKSIVLEIGFGMGEHFIYQASRQPDQLFIGAEVYLNGIANVLRLAKHENMHNILLWPDNVDLIIKDMPPNCLSEIYLLFPDPWPKRKHHKKRFLNKERLNLLHNKLKYGGSFTFASDVEDYFVQVKYLLINNGFKLLTDNFLDAPDDYIPTKYHNKAQIEGRTVRFLQAFL